MGSKLVPSLVCVGTFGVLLVVWGLYRWFMTTRIKEQFQEAWGEDACGPYKYATQLLSNAKDVPTVTDEKTHTVTKAYCMEAEAFTNSVILFLTLTLLYWMLQGLRMQWKTYLQYPAGIKAKESREGAAAA